MTVSLPTVAVEEARVVPPSRPTARGKFLFARDEKLWVRGVTYGTFRPDADGNEFPPHERVARDLESMRANGINALRTYTTPPPWLLDEALHQGLRVMVGLAAERYVGYLNEPGGVGRVTDIVRRQVDACGGHPAILGFAVGNEIPAPIVRWFGRRRMERFIERACEAVRGEDPHALVTYANYPSTEYLQLPCLDLVTFNVYLESPARFAAYLARLQNVAGERPLLMGEMGLDSVRNGEEAQAASISAQVGTAFAAGCAGAFVYAWTDEWHRGGEDVEDWAFGLVRRDRRPKPALTAARDAFAASPFPADRRWPRVSVVMCSCNGARTLRECLDGLLALDYPDYEVVIVDDGSTDATAAIAQEYPFALISTPNRGLAAARNTGCEASDGEIVAYIDDDARPDPHWLRYLAATFMEGDWAAVGGPNLAPPHDAPGADCVANAPGGPTHVLLSDREAEHLPGCNMAIRRDALEAIGGFDQQFHAAGDDVDVCWRLRERGLELGFCPAAVVWHHRRASLRGYVRQQRGYGQAEAMLARKWPEKYNPMGHVAWRGRLYCNGSARELTPARRWRVYYGTQGSGPFQSLYQPPQHGIAALALMPEWHLLVTVLAALSLLGTSWPPLLFAALPLFAISFGAVLVQAIRGALAARFPTPPPSKAHEFRMRALVALLHVLQPAARLYGRVTHGLTPWRWRAAAAPRLPLPRTWAFWSTAWTDPRSRLRALERGISATGAKMVRGGDYDAWDIEARLGMVVCARVQLAVEEHSGRAQLIRARAFVWPSPIALGAGSVFGLLAVISERDHAHGVAVALAGVMLALLGWLLFEAALVAGAVAQAVEHVDESAVPVPSRRRLRNRSSAGTAPAYPVGVAEERT